MQESQKPRVLIVDDDPENIGVLMGALKDDYCIVAAKDGDKAMEIALRDPHPDLVLLDVLMPGIDGYEVCRRFKEHDRLAEIPIIFVTILTETTDKLRGFALGGQDYITKPYDYEEVRARVHTHVSLYQLQRELQEKNRRLEELEALKNNLVQMIIHDLRSPMASTTGFLDMAERAAEKGRTEDAVHYLSSARSSAARMQALVEQILDVGRLEEQRLPLKTARCDAVAQIRQAAEELESTARDRDIRVLADGPIEIEWDCGLMRRVMHNLVSNALRFTPAGSSVTVSLTSAGDALRVEVSDHGPGISAIDQEHVFDKFYQGETGRERQGSGLGLTFCKLAVEAHRGIIGVKSTPGEGAAFWFEMPRHPAAAAKEAP